MAVTEREEDVNQLTQNISRVLNDVLSSNATHLRKLRDLSALRSNSSRVFFTAFSKTLAPLFAFRRRTAAAERAVRFAAVFASTRDSSAKSSYDAFLEDFLRFLLVAAIASDKTARFRACQIISEIIMRLPDDAEVSNELWDEVIDCMKIRVGDKVPIIRTFAVRALSRFVHDSENSDILELFLEVLPLEQNAEVRKTIILSLPPSNVTAAVVIDCTLDINESVRKAAYCVLSNKFPLQSVSIKLRTIILERGLADRSVAVMKECFKLLKDEWLVNCCNGDPIELLKYLDVETYESVGESVMGALLKARLVKVLDVQSIRQLIASDSDKSEVSYMMSGDGQPTVQLMEPEIALYWRIVCSHLQMEAQEKGSDAAATTGTEAAVYAAEASDNNDLLEKILPETVSGFVELVKVHLAAGPNYRFASRQLLLLGAMLDYSDTTNRKAASAFVQDLLHKPLEQEEDDDGNMIVVGDGINLGGDKDWANAVAALIKKVHAAPGEFEEIVTGVVEELARPCRERTADFMQWMHCLAVTGLLLESTKALQWVRGKDFKVAELLHSLLIPGAKHVHLDVQRVAVRCLGLFGLLEWKLSEDLVKQLRLSYIKGPPTISIMACKALVDLGMWHGPCEVDRAVQHNLSSKFGDDKTKFSPVDFKDADGDFDIELLDLLYAGLDRNDWEESVDAEENDSVQAVTGEGFAKVLLLSENYPSIPTALHPVLLAKLICLYFNNETKYLQRLKQCLFVFFEHYPSLSANHKKCLSKAFVPVMRSMWPGINGNAGGSPVVVSKMRKRAVQASRFMLQMMQAPLYEKEAEVDAGNHERELSETPVGNVELSLESGEEGLAIRISAEVASFHMKKTPAEKSYVLALCKIIALLRFHSSEQEAIKVMRRLLNSLVASVSAEKEIVKELKLMAEHLKAIDRRPDEELSQDQVNLIKGRLGIDFNLGEDVSMAVLPTPVPVPRSTRATRSRRRVRHEESSDEDISPTSVVPTIVGTINNRSQRASKTAALTKMTASRGIRILEDNDDDEEDDSEVTSDEDSDDQFTE